MTNKEYQEEKRLIEQHHRDKQLQYQEELTEYYNKYDKAVNDLERKIKRHFRGIIPNVMMNDSELELNIYGQILMQYNHRTKRNWRLSKDLFDKIIAEYDEFYGEPKYIENAIEDFDGTVDGCFISVDGIKYLNEEF